MKLLQLLLYYLCLLIVISQPTYYLNDIYSPASLEIKQVFTSTDKSTVLVVPVVISIYVYDRLSNGSYQVKQRFNSSPASFTSAGASDDCNLLAIGTYNNVVEVYQRTNGMFALKQNISTSVLINSLSISSDKTFIICGSNNNLVKVYKLVGSFYSLHQQFSDSLSPIKDVEISNDRQFIISGSSNGLVRIYKHESNGTYILKQTINHTNFSINTLAISVNNSLLLTASEDGNLRIYQKQSNLQFNKSQLLLQQGYSMSALAISQDNSQIITGSADTRVRIYTHTKNGYILNQTIIGGNSRITSAVFYDDNSGALVSSTDGKVRHYVSCFSVLYGCSDCLSAIFCSSCSQGFYYSSGQCFKCQSPCVSCISDSACTTCQQGFTLNGISCTKELSLEGMYKLLLSLTIPLYILFGGTIIGIGFIIYKLRNSAQIDPTTNNCDIVTQNIQMVEKPVQQVIKGPDIQKKRKRKHESNNITVEDLSINEITDSSKTNVYETNISKLSFQ